jgi:hypothetical protein
MMQNGCPRKKNTCAELVDINIHEGVSVMPGGTLCRDGVVVVEGQW